MKNSKLIIFLVVFIDLLGFGVMIPMLPFYARFFGADALQIGWLMFVYSFMQMFVAPVWGQLSDRYGRRPILLLTILGQSAAFFWAGFSHSYTSLLLSRVLAGIFAANISTASAYMADITSREERAKGMGLIGAAYGLGFIFGPAIGGLLISKGYQWPSLFAGILSAVNFSWAFFALREPAVTRTDRAANRRKFDWILFKQIFSIKGILIPILIFFLLTFAFVQLEITFGLFVVDRFRLTERDAGILLAGMGLVMALIQGGLIGRLVKKYGEFAMVELGVPFIMFGLLGLIFSPSLLWLILSLCLMALGYSLTNPCLSALTSKAAPQEKQGGVLGLYQSSGSAARILAPPIAGELYKWRITGAFTGGVVIIFLAKLVLLQWRRENRRNSNI